MFLFFLSLCFSANEFAVTGANKFATTYAAQIFLFLNMQFFTTLIYN
jgi:hypothetical protein